MHPILATFLAAMTPIGELRLAIPLALAKYNLEPVSAYVISVLGNLVPVIFLLLFLEAVSLFLIDHSKTFEQFFDWLFERTRKRIGHRYELYGYIALVLFVAIPLPITGAWTGSVAAYLLGIPFWRAFGLIAIGVSIAGVIVTLASMGVISIF
ncbi:hypothetical protein BK004_00375 [bacterium CG10_46_32]|nr:MAG: hypothetical protein BK004_00375 [bacterium CG10_46_32]PIR56574.1 MAG: ligand-binding protein SH3 [Parcubacteria group bacterium CG10_big_fil_rev_8_21_14_0_10_46_32]